MLRACVRTRAPFALPYVIVTVRLLLLIPVCTRLAPLLCVQAVPIFALLAGFAILFVPFFVQISAAARLVAHSGALAEGQVLPQEAVFWPADAAKRSLTALALRNADLDKLYSHRHGSDGAPRTARGRRLLRLPRAVAQSGGG